MVAVKTMAQVPEPQRSSYPNNPRALGELLASELQKDSELTRVEVAGPGFVNMTLAEKVCASLVQVALKNSDGSVLANSHHFARPSSGRHQVDDNLATTGRPLEDHLPTAQKINLEYVSVNPNGPITIGSGRGAAFGSTLANVLQAAGNTIHREYYINDGVNSEQMRLFAESVKAICEGRPVPDNGYKGDYVADVAGQLTTKLNSIDEYQSESQALMLAKQRSDLESFGVTFDTWFSEQSLHDSGVVAKAIEQLEKSNVADTKETRSKVKYAKGGAIEEVEKEVQKGAVDEEGEIGNGESGMGGSEPQSLLPTPQSPTLWLRSTLFGDDQDRVLRRQDGRLTYIASDVAYHEDKFNRPPDADKLITVLGPDHHGYINRLHAVVAAALMAEASGSLASAPEERIAGERGSELTDQESALYGTAEYRDRCLAARKLSDKKLKVMIFQLVRFMKDGKPAPMRKRDGNIYALIDLINEIGEKVKPSGTTEEKQTAGKDVARFFYLMRHHDTTFDFDLDLAEKQSDENPVFYVQYAHARVCSVIEKAKASSIVPGEANPRSIHPKERALILKIADLPYEIQRCANDYAVNRLTTYAVELARTYHHFYDACRVINMDDKTTSQWRLQLCVATKAALKASFDLLGISAPERMDRDTAAV